MTVKENSQIWGPCHQRFYTYRKITQNNLDLSLNLATVTFEFRLKNALDFYNFLKIHLLIIP